MSNEVQLPLKGFACSSKTQRLKVTVALIQADGTWVKEIMDLETGKYDMDMALLEAHNQVKAWFDEQKKQNPLALTYHIYRVQDDKGRVVSGIQKEKGEYDAPGTWTHTVRHYFIIHDDCGISASEPYNTEEEMEAALVGELAENYHVDMEDDLYIAQLTTTGGLEIWTDNFQNFELCACGSTRREHEDGECECENFMLHDEISEDHLCLCGDPLCMHSADDGSCMAENCGCGGFIPSNEEEGEGMPEDEDDEEAYQ